MAELSTPTQEAPKKKQLAYSEYFKNWTREHKGVLRSFNILVARLDALPEESISSNMSLEEGDIKATLMKRAYSSDGHRFYTFRVEVGQDVFFVKSEPASYRVHGYDEFQNTLEVREKLKDIAWVEVVEPLLGYQDKKRKTYFVSVYKPLVPILGDYVDLLKFQGGHEKILTFNHRIQELRKLLPEFHDLTQWNMFYDLARDKIILFDLAKTPQSTTEHLWY